MEPEAAAPTEPPQVDWLRDLGFPASAFPVVAGEGERVGWGRLIRHLRDRARPAPGRRVEAFEELRRRLEAGETQRGELLAFGADEDDGGETGDPVLLLQFVHG